MLLPFWDKCNIFLLEIILERSLAKDEAANKGRKNKNICSSILG